MAKHEKYVCDVCGAERKDANHWFAAFVGEVIVGSSLGKSIYKDDIRFIPWNGYRGSEDGHHRHICGQVCAHKLLDQFLSGELK